MSNITTLVCLLVIAGMLTSSCRNTQPTNIADYTVMVYATGGGNLDHSLEDHIVQSQIAADNAVKFVWQLKYSGSDCPVRNSGVIGKPGATYRFVVEKDILNHYNQHIFKDSSDSATFKMEQPEHIADFIRYAAESAPAKHYILLILDHCRGYSPKYDRTEGRGMLRDLITGNSLTISNLSQGIKLSDIPLECIYFDACLSNSIEYATALRHSAHYFLASSHSIAGGSYSALAESLRNGMTLEGALSDYAESVADFWNKKSTVCSESMDMALTDLSQLDIVLASLRQFTEAKDSLFSHSAEPYRSIIQDIMVEASVASYRPDAQECYRDLYDYTSRLTYMLEMAMLEGTLLRSDEISQMMQATNQFRHAIQMTQPFHYCTLPLTLSGQQLSWNVCLPSDGEWQDSDYVQYKTTDFYRLVNWE